MSERGRHASTNGTFYRDLAVMIGGIVVVGAAVFGLLVLLADNPTESITTTTQPIASDTTTTLPDTTTTTSTPDPGPTTTQVAVRPPTEITVQVLNSGSIVGAAARLTQSISQSGYQTLPPTDYVGDTQDPSRIWYRDDFSPEANLLLSYMPEATVEQIPDPDLVPAADIIMVIGVGYEE